MNAQNHDLFGKAPPARAKGRTVAPASTPPAPAKGRAKSRTVAPVQNPPVAAPPAPAPAPLALDHVPGRALVTLPPVPKALAVALASPTPFVAASSPWPIAALPAPVRSARSLAASKAIANRDKYAAGRKAAETRARNKLAAAGPPSFVDYVSDRIGTRRWIVGPVETRDRDRVAKLADKIVTPAWYEALRAAYLAAHAR